MSPPPLDELSWPVERLGEALGLLAHRAGLIALPARFPTAPEGLAGAGRQEVRRWIDAAADRLEIEAEPLQVNFEGVGRQLALLAPMIVRVRGDGSTAYLVLTRCGRRTAELLDADGVARTVPTARIVRALRRHVETRCGTEVDHLLETARVPDRRRRKARAAILEQRQGGAPIADGWVVRLPPSAGVWDQVRHAGLARLGLLYLAVYIPKIVLWLAAWWVLWQGGMSAEPDWGWLGLWVLLTLANLPLRLLEPWYGLLVSVAAGWLIKRRLLAGAMRLRPDEVRHQGAGQLLSRSIESEAAETHTLDSGVLVLSHTIDLLLTLPLLFWGLGGSLHAAALLAWIAGGGLMAWRYHRVRRRWTAMRLDATHRLVEQMVGHRTRLTQENPALRHRGEDESLEGYLRLSRRMDRSAAAIVASLPGGWLLLSLLLLTPGIVRGGFGTAELALGLGGTLFATMSLEVLSLGVLGVADAAIAWRSIAAMFRAAERPRAKAPPELALADRRGRDTASEPRPVLDASNLVYRYRSRPEAALDRCSLRVWPGDRLLLEGPSGGGKSTLAAVLLGLRSPDAGLLLLDGLDFRSLGADGWRRKVAAAPQDHENHVFLGTFAFNLLMGRQWPPEPEDLRRAQAICTELGLAPLLARMPCGLQQTVGETGWQLSHGERSRLFIARALLQGGELICFDESFTALDPENLAHALDCVHRRASTVLVIAHP